MYKFQNHIEVLEAIKELRAKLPAQRDSHLGQCEVMAQLVQIYACLDVHELSAIVADFKAMNRRSEARLPIKKKAA